MIPIKSWVFITYIWLYFWREILFLDFIAYYISDFSSFRITKNYSSVCRSTLIRNILSLKYWKWFTLLMKRIYSHHLQLSGCPNRLAILSLWKWCSQQRLTELEKEQTKKRITHCKSTRERKAKRKVHNIACTRICIPLWSPDITLSGVASVHLCKSALLRFKKDL